MWFRWACGAVEHHNDAVETVATGLSILKLSSIRPAVYNIGFAKTYKKFHFQEIPPIPFH